MESSNVMAMKCGLIVWLFLSSLSTSDSFLDDPTPVGQCFKNCLANCVYDKKATKMMCPFKCGKACVVNPWTANFQALHVNNYSPCEFECATSKCPELSTEKNPDVKEVVRCVDSCTQTCANNKN